MKPFKAQRLKAALLHSLLQWSVCQRQILSNTLTCRRWEACVFNPSNPIKSFQSCPEKYDRVFPCCEGVKGRRSKYWLVQFSSIFHLIYISNLFSNVLKHIYPSPLYHIQMATREHAPRAENSTSPCTRASSRRRAGLWGRVYERPRKHLYLTITCRRPNIRAACCIVTLMTRSVTWWWPTAWWTGGGGTTQAPLAQTSMMKICCHRRHQRPRPILSTGLVSFTFFPKIFHVFRCGRWASWSRLWAQYPGFCLLVLQLKELCQGSSVRSHACNSKVLRFNLARKYSKICF